MVIKSMLRKIYGDCTSSIGIQMDSKRAKELDAIIKELPQECRDFGFKRFDFFSKGLQVDEEARTDISTVTNEAIDRDNEVIIAIGLDWKQFTKGGGAVMLNHDYSMLPVGRALWVSKIKRDAKANIKTTGWQAKTYYHTRPKTWEGQWEPDGILHMIVDGGLKGKSIGFIPKQFSSPTPDEIKSRPELEEVNFVIRKALVIEYSVASIPSNSEAIVGSKGFKDLTPKCLEHMGLYLPSGYDFEIKQEKSLQDEYKKYKVITQSSVSERLLKALKSR